MDNQREKASIILDEIVDLHPEFSSLPHKTMKDIVDRHISYIVSEIAVYQKHAERQAEIQNDEGAGK